MDKTSKLLLKFVGLVVSYIAFSWLVTQCDTIADKWFTTWLWSTICAIIFTIFFIAWIAETIINWNKID